MVFINKKLGNAFSMKAVDSSLDQEHYFGGSKKAVGLVIRGFSGTSDINDGNVFVLTGANNLSLSWSLTDEQDAPIDSGAFSVRNYGVDPEDTETKFDSTLTFKVSASSVPFDETDFKVFFKDGNSTDWSGFVDVNSSGRFFDKEDAEGYREFSLRFSAESQEPVITLNDRNSQVFFRVENQTNIYAYKDMKLAYAQQLVEDGVLFYKQLDNQNISFTNINRNLMPKFEGNSEESYYNWTNVDEFGGRYDDIIVNPHSASEVYAVGDQYVRRSLDGGDTWTTVEDLGVSDNVQLNSITINPDDEIIWVTGESANGWITFSSSDKGEIWGDPDEFGTSGDRGLGIAASGSFVWVVGEGPGSAFTIRRSTDTGLTFNIEENDDPSFVQAAAYAVDTTTVAGVHYVYVAGALEHDGDFFYAAIKRNINNGASGSWTTVSEHRAFPDDDPSSIDASHDFRALAVVGNTAPQPNQIVAGGNISENGGSSAWVVFSGSSFGATGSFFENTIDAVTPAPQTSINGLAGSTAGDLVYAVGATSGAFGLSPTLPGIQWITRIGGVESSSWDYYDLYEDQRHDTSTALGVAASPNGDVFVCGALGLNNNIGRLGIIRRGTRTANSASLGERGLSFSVNSVDRRSGKEHSISSLANISEFPHASGIFQMKNLVLGTTEQGTVGNTEDSIIQVNYFGSVVKVLWPQQSNQNANVKGFGDFAAGQRAGKLSSQFEPGDFIDVTEFDHMSLYCYVLKDSVGTLDNIDVRVERRPLRSVGFAKEQTVTFAASGSDTTIAQLKDLVYRKEIDYSDLTEKEIAYPIDFPLTNVKEVRISAKHVTGQAADENKNFVVWGRFIKSDEET